VLRGAGYSQIELLPKALEGDELKHKLADAHFVGIRSRTQLTAEVLAHAPKLVAIGAFCIGTNQVDLKAASQQGIAVFNAPYSNTRSVAELVLAEAILLLRGIPARNAAAHRGGWLKSADDSHEIRGKTLGIVGYGSIGTQLSVLAEAWACGDLPRRGHQAAAGQRAAGAQPAGAAAGSRRGQPARAELPSTQWMIGAAEIAAQAGRGVHQRLARHGGRDRAAGRGAEGRPAGGRGHRRVPGRAQEQQGRVRLALRGLDNVILTPHIGGSTLEAQANIGLEVAEKLAKYSDNGSTITSVNFPEVALPAHPGKHRILHVHRNVPGVLSAINRVFSDNHINIAAQYLQTNADIGYVVIDLDAESSDVALQHLADVPAPSAAACCFSDTLSRCAPSSLALSLEGDNASGRRRSGHGVRWHGLLRGHRALSDSCAAGGARCSQPMGRA
jgi:D-3-phosphoglycerate dehydrogenase